MADSLDYIHDILRLISNEYVESKRKPMASLLSICLRAAVYRARSNEQDFINDKMLYGTENHAWLSRRMVDHMAKRGWRCEPEYKLEIDGIGGRADLYCVNGDSRLIFEFKFSKNSTVHNPFLPFYRRQLKYYMAIDAKLNGGMPKGVLLVMDFMLRTWYIEIVDSVDVDATLNDMRKRAAVFEESIANGTLPPREEGPHCNYCSFKRVCYSAQLELEYPTF
jgi:CRISPR/Cas system-associated exonuclease Cas4 (RecB family)